MSRTPRIAVDVRMHGHSGIGTYIKNVVPRIARARPDWQFTLLGAADELSRYDWTSGDNITVVDCGAPIYSLAEQWQLFTRAPRAVDLFWSPHYNIPLLRRGKLLVTVHDVSHLAMPEYVGGAHKRAYARLMFDAVRRKAAMVLCDSRFTASEFRRLVGRTEPAPRTIHLGVGESWFRVRRERRPHERPFLLYVGNVKPHKNVGALLRAFRLVADTIPHDLVIVGKREGLITADPVTASLAEGLGERVHFTGLVEATRLEQYLAHADALVLPSLYEGFGLPPLEAMACGCPVITSDAASLPEVCGEAALYCDPRNPRDIAEKILRLLSDCGLRDELRRWGRIRAASFTWGRCAEQTRAAIGEVLAM